MIYLPYSVKLQMGALEIRVSVEYITYLIKMWYRKRCQRGLYMEQFENVLSLGLIWTSSPIISTQKIPLTFDEHWYIDCMYSLIHIII